MDELKPKAYVLSLDLESDKIVAISGFKTYNEHNGIVTDIKAFIDYRTRMDQNFKKMIIFKGTKNELLKDKILMDKFPNINEKIEQLKETNYLLITGNG